MTNANDLHVVLGGTGGVGGAVVRALVQKGARVRAVSRKAATTLPTGVEPFAADITQADAVRAACAGASIVYFCANPPYAQWATAFPPLLSATIAGTESAGAKLVMADNLYMYAPTTQPLSEDLPWQPATRKGTIRKQMDEMLLAAHQAGKIRMVIGRASDYYGPAAPNSATGAMFFQRLLAGKAVQWLGSIDQPHTLSFSEDFARGLVRLGERDDALGQVWHITAAPPLTGQEYVTLAAEIAGTKAHAVAVGPAMMRVASVFIPVLREMIEMRYEFTEPYIMDGTKFAQAFGFAPTPHRQALTETIAWYRAQGG